LIGFTFIHPLSSASKNFPVLKFLTPLLRILFRTFANDAIGFSFSNGLIFFFLISLYTNLLLNSLLYFVCISTERP